MANQIITEYTSLQDLYLQPKIINNIGQNTEHLIINKTLGDVIINVYMKAGSGDINTNRRLTHDGVVSNGNGLRDYYTYDGNRGAFINLSYGNKVWSALGGSGSVSGLHNRDRYNWTWDTDSSGGRKNFRWEYSGSQAFYDYQISREGQRKNVVLLFKKDTQLRINWTCYNSKAWQGDVMITPLRFKA